MSIVHGEYKDVMWGLMNIKSPLGDYYILVLLVGVFNHLCVMLGHQGSSAAYLAHFHM